MGMYDSFILRTPMQCPVCKTGAHREFQTKELRCHLDEFVEGKPAVKHHRRDPSDREILDAKQMDDILYPGDSDKWEYILPHKYSEEITFQLPDGEYPTYTWCDHCEDFFFITAIIRKGIFVGIKEKRGMEL